MVVINITINMLNVTISTIIKRDIEIIIKIKIAPFPLFAGDPKALFLAREVPWEKVITTIILIIGSSNSIILMTIIIIITIIILVVVIALSPRHHHHRLCQG